MDEIHRLHTIYSKCLSILLGGNACHCSSSTIPELDSVSKEIPGDILVGERAEVLYNLSWLSLKALYSKEIRYGRCSNLQDILIILHRLLMHLSLNNILLAFLFILPNF